MKAIIAPLNKIFYHFEKYDGSTTPQRFFQKHLWLQNTLYSKILVSVFWTPLAVVIGALFFLFYLGPVFIKFYFTLGYSVAREKLYETVDKFSSMLDNVWVKKDIAPQLSQFRSNAFSLFVYYTPEMIPAKPRAKKFFFERLQKMKTALELKDILFAKSKTDIENLITKYGVNPEESFFMSDGKINLDHVPMLNSFGGINE